MKKTKRLLGRILSFTLVCTMSVSLAAPIANAKTISSIEKITTYAASTSSSKSYEKKVLKLINIQRKKHGLKAFKLKKKLSKVAVQRAKELTISFSHMRPNGKSCFTVYNKMKLSYKSAGENIAAGQTSPAKVVNSWMHSSGHRANILSSKYKYMGIGFCYDSSSDYMNYWAQEFCN